jgi:hypothetical protein
LSIKSTAYTSPGVQGERSNVSAGLQGRTPQRVRALPAASYILKATMSSWSASKQNIENYKIEVITTSSYSGKIP